MRTRRGHPSARKLEDAAYQRLPEAEAAAVRAHVAVCPVCGPRWRAERTLAERLATLREGEPRFDVAEAVREQLDEPERRHTAEGAAVQRRTPVARRLPRPATAAAAIS